MLGDYSGDVIEEMMVNEGLQWFPSARILGRYSGEQDFVAFRGIGLCLVCTTFRVYGMYERFLEGRLVCTVTGRTDCICGSMAVEIEFRQRALYGPRDLSKCICLNWLDGLAPVLTGDTQD